VHSRPSASPHQKPFRFSVRRIYHISAAKKGCSATWAESKEVILQMMASERDRLGQLPKFGMAAHEIGNITPRGSRTVSEDALKRVVLDFDF